MDLTEATIERDKLLMANITHLITKVLDLEIKTTVLTNIVVKSGAATMEELRELYEAVENRDYPNKTNELMESLDRYIKAVSKTTE